MPGQELDRLRALVEYIRIIVADTDDQEQRDALWKRMGSEQHKIANEIAKALEDRDA